MKIVYLFIAGLLLALTVKAQNTIRPNIYLQDMHYYNPASVRLDSNHHSQSAVYGKYKSVENEMDIWNKPAQIWLNHAGRIGQGHSFYTVSYVNDRYSFFNRNALYLGHVREIRKGASRFTYGGRIVANIDAVHWDRLVLPHTGNGKTLHFNPDLDLGVTYQHRRFNAGLGMKNLIETHTKADDAILLKNHREMNLNLSYRMNIGRPLAVTPFVLLAHERNTLIDAGISFTLFNRIDASYALRVNELKSVIVLDAQVYKGWSLGLAYDRSSLVSDHNFDLVLRYRK